MKHRIGGVRCLRGVFVFYILTLRSPATPDVSAGVTFKSRAPLERSITRSVYVRFDTWF